MYYYFKYVTAPVYTWAVLPTYDWVCKPVYTHVLVPTYDWTLYATNSIQGLWWKFSLYDGVCSVWQQTHANVSPVIDYLNPIVRTVLTCTVVAMIFESYYPGVASRVCESLVCPILNKDISREFVGCGIIGSYLVSRGMYPDLSFFYSFYNYLPCGIQFGHFCVRTPIFGVCVGDYPCEQRTTYWFTKLRKDGSITVSSASYTLPFLNAVGENIRYEYLRYFERLYSISYPNLRGFSFCEPCKFPVWFKIEFTFDFIFRKENIGDKGKLVFTLW